MLLLWRLCDLVAHFRPPSPGGQSVYKNVNVELIAVRAPPF